MSRFRRWFAWVFLIATIVAQAPHDHCQPTINTTEAFGGCDDTDRHWAGHETADGDSSPDFCPICQHRLQHQIIGSAAPAIAVSISSPVRETGPATVEAGRLLRSRSRAPPSV